MPARPEALVVDDDDDMNRMIGAYAELCGFVYRPARSGQAALDEIARHTPSIVLLDVMLPDIDGFEVCRRIRENEQAREVPVILITALTDPDSRARGLESRANDYLPKPFNPDRLIEIMTRYSKPTSAAR